MLVTNIRVVFDRKRQPAQYESSGAVVEFAATVGDTEDHVAVAAKLLGDAKTLVLTELGIVKPGESASATVIAANGTGTTGKPSTARTSGEAIQEQLSVKDAEKAAKAAVKAAEKAAKDAAAKEAEKAKGVASTPSTETPAEDFPGEGTAAPASGAAANADLPADETASTGAPAATASAKPALTHTDIHNFIAENIKAKKLDHPTVKGVSAEFAVARIADLKPEQLSSYKAKIEEAMKKLGGNSDVMADL